MRTRYTFKKLSSMYTTLSKHDISKLKKKPYTQTKKGNRESQTK